MALGSQGTGTNLAIGRKGNIMANEKITGRITGQGPGDAPGITNIIVRWEITSPVGNAAGGENVFPIDMQLTDSEIEASLRDQLAAFVSGLATVDQTIRNFTASDVRGCSF